MCAFFYFEYFVETQYYSFRYKGVLSAKYYYPNGIVIFALFNRSIRSDIIYFVGLLAEKVEKKGRC